VLKKIEEGERFRIYRVPREEREEVLSRIRRILGERDEILLAIVHGSFMREEAFRDVDVAVYTGRGVDPLIFELKLEKELSAEVGYPFDVRVLNYAPPWFVKVALEKGEILIDRGETGLAVKLYLRALDELTFLSTRNLVKLFGD